MIDGGNKAGLRTVLWLAGVAALLSWWSYYHQHALRAEVASGLAVLLLITALRASWTQRIHKTWMKVSTALGFINSRLLLGIVYLFVVVPIGLVVRALGFDPLLRRGKERSSYWLPRAHTRQTKKQFELTF